MKYILMIAITAAFTVMAMCQSMPSSRTDNVTDTVQGKEIVDPYRWLENQNSKETRDWIDAQNAYTKAQIGALSGADKLRKRLTQFYRVDRVSMPTEENGWYFLTKMRPDQDLGVYYRRKGLKGADEVVLDSNTLSPDHTVTAFAMNISHDAKMMLYGIRKGGKDEHDIHIMDLDTKKDIHRPLPELYYTGAVLKKDKSGFYYGRIQPEGPRLYYHSLLNEDDPDRLIFGADYGPGKWIDASISENGRWLIINAAKSDTQSDLYIQDLQNGGEIIPVAKDLDGMFYGEAADDQFYMYTDYLAPNGKVLKFNLNHPEQANWKEVIPTSDNILTSFSLAGHKLVINSLKDVHSQIKAYDSDGKWLYDYKLPSIGIVTQVNSKWDSDNMFYGFDALATPGESYQYNMKTRHSSIWHRSQVPVKPSNFVVTQVFYSSKDGTQIPMFMLYKKGLKIDGHRPTLISGYGGFGVTELPNFSAQGVLWAEHGGIYVSTCLRGGGEYGKKWHLAGMLDKKQNVFDDFIGAADYMIKKGYTSPDNLAIAGGSNGGLLVGAAFTQRPELFKAVVCWHPLLDMVRYQKFMQAQFWVPEYGSSDDPKQASYLYDYSPYHHVTPGTKYPSILFISGDADTRVDPLHARKMTALMQSVATPDRPVMLLYDTKGGHSGGKPLSQIIDEDVMENAFLFQQVGVKL